MNQSISARIRSALYGACRVRPDEMIVVGVSGGIDSVFLLTQLTEIHQPLTAAVFNHHLRPEAAEECEFVRNYCHMKGTPCFTGEADVASYAAENGLGIEEAARELRYRFLFRIAEEQKAAAVATAHHANDQAETVLMHILRGSGIDGLCGIRSLALPNAFSDSIALIRPLLGIRRDEIEQFAEETGMPYREDHSNSDMSYTRNRIRLDLIPKLAEDYNPRIVEALCRLAENAGADQEILDRDAEAIVRYANSICRGDRVEWSRKVYCTQPQGMRLRMLRLLIDKLEMQELDPGYLNLKEADDFFMTARENQSMPFLCGTWLRCEGITAVILKDIKINQWKYPQFSQGWTLSAEKLSVSERELAEWIEKAKRHPEIAVLNANQLASEPELRRIRPGERFEPYGLGGKSQKLSDFLVNNKIPKEYRADLAVAADAAGIIWIPGLRVSDRCALRPHTHRIAVLKLSHSDDGGQNE